MGLSKTDRLELMVRLGEYLVSGSPELELAIRQASAENPWFSDAFIRFALTHISDGFLQRSLLENWTERYMDLGEPIPHPKQVGLVMAGNIPLVGFHDFLCCFMSGHSLRIKPSSKDQVLIHHIIHQLWHWAPETSSIIQLPPLLKGCDAFIATGSDNTARYFSYYFREKPHLIRKNRTSVAILSGAEKPDDLHALANDMFQYYGLGCRNVTQIYVPENYDFIPFLEGTQTYGHLMDFHRYKHNYDYQLAMLLLNNRPYMSHANVLLVEDPSHFSPISVVHYQHYQDVSSLQETLRNDETIQSMAGLGGLPFGSLQHPQLDDYADGVDTMQFLCSIC